MRTFKIFGIFLSAVLTVFGMTSCFNSDDNSNRSLTKEQIQQCYFAVAGPHSGKLVYVAGKSDKGNSKTDSIPTSWNITSDSTMVLNNVSAKAVASLIDTTSAEHKEIRNAIAAQPSKQMSCYIGFVNMNPVQWLINPTGLTYNVTYGGAKHEIKLVFAANNSYSFGQYNSTSRTMQLQLIAYGAYIDGTFDKSTTPLVLRGTPLWFVQK